MFEFPAQCDLLEVNPKMTASNDSTYSLCFKINQRTWTNGKRAMQKTEDVNSSRTLAKGECVAQNHLYFQQE